MIHRAMVGNGSAISHVLMKKSGLQLVAQARYLFFTRGSHLVNSLQILQRKLIRSDIRCTICLHLFSASSSSGLACEDFNLDQSSSATVPFLTFFFFSSSLFLRFFFAFLSFLFLSLSISLSLFLFPFPFSPTVHQSLFLFLSLRFHDNTQAELEGIATHSDLDSRLHHGS